MSIFCLRTLGMKLNRQACILAHNKLVVPESAPGVRSAASSNKDLFKMVKKRTLEARSKLQANRYPNNQPCVSQKFLDSEEEEDRVAPSRALPTPSISKSERQKEKIHKSSAMSTESKPEKLSFCKKLSFPNFEAAKSDECDKPVSICEDSYRGSKTTGRTTVPCPGDSGGGADDGPGDKEAPCKKDSGMDKNRKILLWLLAALGAGGLLYWLLSRKDQEEECAEPTYDVPKKIPPNSSDLPKHVPYLLIGGGTASFSAFRAIKSHDPTAKVLMITNEFRKPYMRPPLSKELWYSSTQGEVPKDYRFKQWTGSERSLFFEPDEFFVNPKELMDNAKGGIAVAQGYSVKKVDPIKHVITLSDGYEIGYDECLLATGCMPKNLPVFMNAPISVKEKIMVYRTPDDFERLKRYVDANKTVTIVGNGFIGSELACSLANYGRERKVKVFQIFPEKGNMSKVLPEYLSKWTTKKIEALGVCVVPNASVKDAQRDETTLKLHLDNGSTILTDIVVVCIGCEANTKIASTSGLEVDYKHGGFLVNAELEARRNLFVAGDASCFYDPLLGRRRVEHHDNSVLSGKIAGENMVGKKKPYTHQSMFWSDLGPEIGYEGIGLVDSGLKTVGVFALPTAAPPDRSTDNLTEARDQKEEQDETPNTSDKPDVECDSEEKEQYGRGVVFYVKDKKVVGILLWNLFNRVGLARTVINQNRHYEDLNDVAKLFEIHS